MVAPQCQKKLGRETYSFLECTGCWFHHYLQNYYWFSKLLGQQIDAVIYISRDISYSGHLYQYDIYSYVKQMGFFNS
jgi:hypothetical protein